MSVYLPTAYVVRREGNVLTRVCPSFCLSTPGGVYPGQVQVGGYPCQGVPHLWYPPSDLAGGTPPRVPPSDLAGGYPTSSTPPPPVRPGQGGYPTSDGVLDTPRSVWLLRSRRRTFLLQSDNTSILGLT